jgi:hypothetical protein
MLSVAPQAGLLAETMITRFRDIVFKIAAIKNAALEPSHLQNTLARAISLQHQKRLYSHFASRCNS